MMKLAIGVVCVFFCISTYSENKSFQSLDADLSDANKHQQLYIDGGKWFPVEALAECQTKDNLIAFSTESRISSKYNEIVRAHEGGPLARMAAKVQSQKCSS